MADEVLSQHEIDALLSALTTGNMEAEELKKEDNVKRARTYDFKRALRFSKDQIRSIARIHENFARLLTTLFSSQLRTYVNISVASVDQIPYEEFIRSIPKVTVLNIYNFSPLDGKIIMEVNPNISYGMLDRLLGGKGDSINKIDNLTEIETILISQLFDKATVILKEAWSSLIDVEPELENIEINPQFLQLVSPNETVVVVSLNTAIGEVSGMINICIPHILLEPIIPRLSVQYWMQTTARTQNIEERNKLVKNIEDVYVDAKAILGETTITIQQLLDLNHNDIISLNQEISEPLVLKINDEPKFHVQPGKHKNKLSVQILDEIKRGVENDE